MALALAGAICVGHGLHDPAVAANGDARDDRATADRNAVVSLGFCTGTLITDLIVLTAAHCVRPALRLPRPDSDTVDHCARLPQQHDLQTRAWEDPMTWHILPRGKTTGVALGGTRDRPDMVVMVRAYSLPRCADIALLQLVRRVPPALATPIRVLTALPEGVDNPDAFFHASDLRYAGWGLGGLSPKHLNRRQTGRVSYWDRNSCMIYTLPPERSNGTRIVKGDSGSPLLLALGGTEVVAGVLFGSGLPDAEICGLPVLPPPARHGAYTPTFRRAIPGTDATDLAAWIAHFAPDAVWAPPPAPAGD